MLVFRDPSGYGLTLSSDQPVFVQTVRPGGAASRAGIRENDVILRVNGRRVTEASHSDVVALIQGKKRRRLKSIVLMYTYCTVRFFPICAHPTTPINNI